MSLFKKSPEKLKKSSELSKVSKVPLNFEKCFKNTLAVNFLWKPLKPSKI